MGTQDEGEATEGAADDADTGDADGETTEGDAPAEKPTGDAPAAGETTEAKPEGEAADPPPQPEIAEDVLKTAAEKYAKGQLALANKTMAAARRAERAVDTVKTENVKLREDLKQYSDFVDQLRSTPLTALQRLGFPTFRDFAAHIAANGGDAKPETPEERIARLEQEFRNRDERQAKQSTEAQTTAFRDAIEEAIEEHKTEYARTATSHGKRELWGAVEAYAKMHKLAVHEVPDAAVAALAGETEKLLRAEFGDPVPAPAPGAKGATAATPAAPAASTSGKTLAGKATSGAPKTREYSMDPEERRRQINEDLRKEGIL
jgi:hypothetical protein